MGETDYNALLYDKMKAEQDKYRDWLLNQPPEEILNHTYEYTMREDIVMCMEELELSPKQAKALLRSPCPLDDVYKEFRDREVEHMLVIASACKNMWVSLGIGVILVFTLSILPQDNIVLSLFPFASPYQMLSAAVENSRTTLFLAVCGIETVVFGITEVLYLKVRRCFE